MRGTRGLFQPPGTVALGKSLAKLPLPLQRINIWHHLGHSSCLFGGSRHAVIDGVLDGWGEQGADVQASVSLQSNHVKFVYPGHPSPPSVHR